MIIDAKDLIIGRLGTVIAKKALLGEGVSVINCEKAVVTGNKKTVLDAAKRKFEMGTPSKGPFIPKLPDKYLKRAIRGMLPYKQAKGKSAFNRIKCYVGFPESFKDQKIETLESANVSKLPNAQYVSIREICRWLGGKI